MSTKIDPNSTRFPTLTAAVLAHLSPDELADVARHGADIGWNGFTYYQDTLAFFAAHKRQILALAEELAEDCGEDMLTMIQGFNCLKEYGLSPTEIGEAIWGGEGENAIIIRNALAWFALEEVAFELNPDL